MMCEISRKAVTFVFLLAVYLLLQASSLNARLIVGSPAPDFKLQDLNGNYVKLSDFKGKKHVIIDFWATWCVPCRMVMPVLHKAADRYAAADVQVISLNLREDHKKIAKFIKGNDFGSFVVLRDASGKVGTLYGVRGIPHLAFIDKQGNYRGNRTATEFMTVGAYAAPMKEYFGVEDPMRPGVSAYDPARPPKGGLVLADFREGLGEWELISDGKMKGKSTVVLGTGKTMVLNFDLIKSKKWKGPFAGLNWLSKKTQDLSGYKKIVVIVARSWQAEPGRSHAFFEVAFGEGKGSESLPMGMVEIPLSDKLSVIELDMASFELSAWTSRKFKVKEIDWTKFRGLELFVQVENTDAKGSLSLLEIRAVK